MGRIEREERAKRSSRRVVRVIGWGIVVAAILGTLMGALLRSGGAL